MTVAEVLGHVQSGAVPVEAYLEWDADRVKRIEAKASASAPRQLTCKVSEKDCLSVYGLNRQWPVSLYAEQWERLEKFMPTVMEFIKANNGKLSRKGE
jgi:hypothetical protein